MNGQQVPQSFTVPTKLIGLGLIAMGLWGVLQAVGSAALSLMALVLPVIVVGAWVKWRRWFPRRATEELNKVILMNPVMRQAQARARLRRWKQRGGVYEVAWRVPTAVTTSGLVRSREVFEQALDCSAEFWYDRGLVWMRAGVCRLPKRIGFRDFYRGWKPAGELVMGVGAGRAGSVWFDLPQIPHLLVGGTPGSGKSVFLRQAITALVLEHGPEALSLVLIDLKGGMEFNLFEDLPHLMVPIVSDVPQVESAVTAVLTELDRRQALFAGAKVEKLSRWNELRPNDRLPHVVVVVDEFGEVSAVESSDGGTRARPKAMLALFARLARLGRASGIHLIACTQRPDHDVMPGQIKDQIPATVAFRTRSAVAE